MRIKNKLIRGLCVGGLNHNLPCLPRTKPNQALPLILMKAAGVSEQKTFNLYEASSGLVWGGSSKDCPEKKYQDSVGEIKGSYWIGQLVLAARIPSS